MVKMRGFGVLIEVFFDSGLFLIEGVFFEIKVTLFMILKAFFLIEVP